MGCSAAVRLAFTMICLAAAVYASSYAGEAVAPVECHPGTSPSWAPDGRLIAFFETSSGKPQLALYDSTSGAIDRLTGVWPYPGATPVWSADQSRLFVTCFTTEMAEGERTLFRDPNLLRWDTRSRTLTALTNFRDGVVGKPAVGATGELVCFSAPKAGAAYKLAEVSHATAAEGAARRNLTIYYDGVWVLSRDEPPRMLLPEQAAERCPSMTPDGRRVLLTRYTEFDLTGQRRPHTDLVLCDIETGQTSALTRDGVSFGGLLSPDGAQIAYSRAGTGGEIWLMNADGSAPRKIKGGPFVRPNVETLTWSRDGRFVLFLSEGDVFAVPTSGVGLYPLTSGLGIAERYGFSLHPDNKRIAFTKDEKVMIAELDWSRTQSAEKH